MSTELAQGYAEEKVHPDDWDIRALKDAVFKQFSMPLQLPPSLKDLTSEGLKDLISEQARNVYNAKEAEFGEEMMRQVEKMIYLQVIDTLWKEHLLNMDHLKEGIGLRGYAQRDPLREYQKEGYNLFIELLDRIHAETLDKLFMVQIARTPMPQQTEPVSSQKLQLSRGGGEQPTSGKTVKREGKKVGRNDPCPCGSGKKYKKCCGA